MRRRVGWEDEDGDGDGARRGDAATRAIWFFFVRALGLSTRLATDGKRALGLFRSDRFERDRSR